MNWSELLEYGGGLLKAASQGLTPTPPPYGSKEEFVQKESINPPPVMNPLARFLQSKVEELANKGPPVEDRPLNERTYLESIARWDRSPITEKNLDPEHLAILRNMVMNKSKSGTIPRGNIQYKDYPEEVRKLSSWEDKSAGKAGEVATTIGRAKYVVDPDTQDVTIRDTYDFDPHVTGNVRNLLDHIPQGAYGAVRWLGTQLLPPNKGRDVNIKIKAQK